MIKNKDIKVGSMVTASIVGSNKTVTFHGVVTGFEEIWDDYAGYYVNAAVAQGIEEHHIKINNGVFLHGKELECEWSLPVEKWEVVKS